MKIKIQYPVGPDGKTPALSVKRTVDGQVVKNGDVVDVNECTARNLIKKGYALAADREAENLDLEAKGVQNRLMAQASISRIITLQEKLGLKKQQPRAAA